MKTQKKLQENHLTQRGFGFWFFKILFIYFREREGEREGEKHRCERERHLDVSRETWTSCLGCFL